MLSRGLPSSVRTSTTVMARPEAPLGLGVMRSAAARRPVALPRRTAGFSHARHRDASRCTALRPAAHPERRARPRSDPRGPPRLRQRAPMPRCCRAALLPRSSHERKRQGHPARPLQVVARVPVENTLNRPWAPLVVEVRARNTLDLRTAWIGACVPGENGPVAGVPGANERDEAHSLRSWREARAARCTPGPARYRRRRRPAGPSRRPVAPPGRVPSSGGTSVSSRG
jgi:hypothetical protein